jgi:arylsulfatase A-like enzyme
LAEGSTQIVILSASLTAGFLNMASATLPHPEIHQDLLALFSFLAVGVAVAATAQLALWLLASKLLLRFGVDRLGLSIAIAVLFVSIASLWPLLALLESGGGLEGLALQAVIATNAVFAPLLAYQLTIRTPAKLRELGSGLALLAPFTGGLALIFLWLQMYRIEGITSPTSLICTAVLGIAALVATGLVVWLKQRVRALPCLVVFTAVVIAAPLALLVSTAVGSATSAPPAKPGSPSVLLLTVDTLRADALDLINPGQSRTPALAKLATESMVFEQARTAAPWTKASVASMLTGLSPLVHRTTTTVSRLPDEIQTLAESLRDRGYRTAAIGRNSYMKENSNLQQGFDDYFFYPSEPGASVGGKILSRLAPTRFGWSDPSSADLTEMALNWIGQNHDRPFLLWLHYFDPHIPYEPHPSLVDGEAPSKRIGNSFSNYSGIRTGHFVPSDAEQLWIRELYDAEVRDVDANAGRVLEALQELNLYAPMLIAFTSDHGEEFFEHGGFEHGHVVYDEVIRVPLFFKLPGGSSTGRISAAVSIESVTPTVLEVLGASEGAGPFTSDSLAGYWKPGAEPPTVGPQLATGVLYYEEKTSLIFDGLKYIRGEQSGSEELFDLNADPAEAISLSDSMPERLVEARALINQKIHNANKLRRSLNLPEVSVLEPDAEWLDRLRELGYVE